LTAVTMKELLEAGVHFGHQTKRWNPKMREFIFGQRNGIYIINLQKTLIKFREAIDFVQQVSVQGGALLFVGTKRQAQEAVAEEATRVGMPYVNQRWLGGTLTNYRTIKKRIERLRWLETFLQNPVEGRYTKKELLQLEKERVKLAKVLTGIKTLDRLPDALFIIDPKKEHIAVQEARKLDIPVVAVVDTNCDPEDIDYPIPGNDDAIRAIKLFASRIADAILEGRSVYEKQAGEQESEEAALIAAGGGGVVVAGMPALGDESAGARHARRGGAADNRRPAPRRRPTAPRPAQPAAETTAAPEAGEPEAEAVNVEGGAERKAAAPGGRAVIE
jgi:small subunit ribosomal protein S2